MKSLVEYVGETYVAEAFFNGKLDELEKAFDKKAGESMSTSVSNFSLDHSPAPASSRSGSST